MPILGIPTSKQDLANNPLARKAATTTARGAATVNDFLGDDASAARQRAFANNVDNPNVNYRGVANPTQQQGQQHSSDIQDQRTPDTPYVLSSNTVAGGGNGGYNAADLAMFDAGISTANNSLGLLDRQYEVGAGNIGNSYNSALTRLLGSKSAAEGQYNTTRSRAVQDNVDARSQIDASVGRNANALQRLLGSRGAGNSSAAQIAAPYAAAFQGTQQRMGVERDYSRNMQDLDSNYNMFNTEWNQSREELDRDKFQEEQALRATVAEKRSGLLQSLAELNAKKAAAQGGNSATALAAAQPYLNQVNSLQGEIVNLGQQYANPISVNTPQYAAPDLRQYQYDTALNAAPGNTSALTDTISPAYATLLGINRRREQQNIGF